MKVKKIIQEDMMTLPELREELIAIRDKRGDNAEETEGTGRTLSYELRKSIDHADSLGKCSVETAKSLFEELEGVEKITPEIAARLVNIMPQTRDEIRAIYAKERFSLLPDDIDAILDILKKHA
ncbi:MAG TPA: RNA polymerase Rpb4 family protein [Methanocorpusculum sp.]|nr:RNA polymerase Rpb4 family protein [Methanocorpusculum sp.]HJJ38535.1 RNA polymerase Rpb4 family protein [Methanocorpusculum sp.]